MNQTESGWGSNTDHFGAPIMKAQIPAARHFAAWFLALFAVTQFPLYWVQYPDIDDFPNHLARLHVLMHLAESGTLQRYYAIQRQISTNLAMEVVVPALASWMNLALALKLFASLATLLLTTGAVALGRAVTGRVSYLLLGVMIFAHNAMFQLGLLNYLFGLGVAFWLVSAWIFARQRDGVCRWFLFAAGCILVYLCHLSALGVYAIGVLGYELGRVHARGRTAHWEAWHALALALTQFLPVLIVHVLSTHTDSNPPTQIEGATYGVLIAYKATLVLFAPLLSVSGYPVSRTVIGILLALALYIGFRGRALRLVVPVRWMASGLAVAIALLPPAGFGSNLVDMRLIPALSLMLWSGLELAGRSKWLPKVLLAVIAATVILISLETTWQWVLRDDEYRRVRTALTQVPEGSKIATVALNGPASSPSISPHCGAWSIIDRAAFLSNFYVWPFQPVWVAYREPFVSQAQLVRLDYPSTKPPAYAVLKNVYDYVLVFGGNAAKRDLYSPNAESVFDSPSLRILRTGLEQPR